MSKITWYQTGIHHNAKIENNIVGCCWQGAEDIEVFHYVSHKGSGQVSSLEEAKEKIEQLNTK